MSKRAEKTLCPDWVVVYCSSVWGGFSWILIQSTKKAEVRALCRDMEEELGASFCCFTLASLVRRKTSNKDVNQHMRDFISSLKNKEYEDYENLPSSALKIASLLDANNASLLLELLELFFDTGYTSGGVADYIADRGMTVLLCS
jgi:hypothetical protein